ncbi:MAG: hypothetical protein ACK4TA_07025 [Saprospiraceae bacterium]
MKKLSFTLLILFFLLQHTQASDPCSDFIFSVEYYMVSLGKYYAFEIKDDCEHDLLIIKDGWLSNDKPPTIDTILLSNEVLEKFKYDIRLVNKSKLKNIDNPYLNDGMVIICNYIDQQGNGYNYEMTLPVFEPESVLSIEEEIFILKKFQIILDQFVKEQQLKTFKYYVNSFGLDKY